MQCADLKNEFNAVSMHNSELQWQNRQLRSMITYLLEPTTTTAATADHDPTIGETLGEVFTPAQAAPISAAGSAPISAAGSAPILAAGLAPVSQAGAESVPISAAGSAPTSAAGSGWAGSIVADDPGCESVGRDARRGVTPPTSS